VVGAHGHDVGFLECILDVVWQLVEVLLCHCGYSNDRVRECATVILDDWHIIVKCTHTNILYQWHTSCSPPLALPLYINW
jgi:hypothetical protein